MLAPKPPTALDRYTIAARGLGSRLLDTRRWGIKRTDLMLDVGSGQDPHPRANVLVDRFVDSNLERLCNAAVVIDRPLFVADAAHLPFSAKTFDFVNCSHVLEHVPDPPGVLADLARVSRRGYVETPSAIYEKLWGWQFHRWFVSVEDDRLVFAAKDRVIFDGDLNTWFANRMGERDFWWFFLRRLRRFGLLTTYLWTDDIQVEVRGELNHSDLPQFASASEAGESETSPELSASDLTRGLKTWLGQWLRRTSDRRVDVALRFLCCPRCGASVERAAGDFACPACQATFRGSGNITVMLPEISAATEQD